MLTWAYSIREVCRMKAAIYIRVGNKDQLAPETDNNKKEQEFENYCKKLQQRTAGGYIPQQQSGKNKKLR